MMPQPIMAIYSSVSFSTPTMPAPFAPPNTTYSTIKAAAISSSTTMLRLGNSTVITAVAAISWEMMLINVPTELRIDAESPAAEPYSWPII